MCKYFVAGDDLAIETERDMDPPGMPVSVGRRKGLMRAYISVYEPGDEAHPSLPTLREFLERCTDPKTGLLNYKLMGPMLSIDSAPLRALPAEYLDYRVAPGSSFVTHEALELARAEGIVPKSSPRHRDSLAKTR